MTNVKMEVQTKEGQEAVSQLEQLRRENAELQRQIREREAAAKSITFSVVEFKHKKTGEIQRGINVHGVTAKPMFLYGSQALKLVEVSERLGAFVEENRERLSWK